MIPDAFRRLALIAACSGYGVCIVVVWQTLGWAAAVAVVVWGMLAALGLTIDTTPKPDQPEPEIVEAMVARADVNLLDAELKRRARNGEVPVATRKGRPLASVEGSIEVEKI